MAFILTFYAIIFLLIVSGTYVYLIFHNKKVLGDTEKFISKAQQLDSVVIKKVRLRYWSKRGQKFFVYPTNQCDLYLFHNCLALVRKKNKLFNVSFAPILITADISGASNTFPFLSIFQPTLIRFKKIVAGEIDIVARNRMRSYKFIDITLKGLTKEQAAQLETIKCWIDVP